MPNRGLVPERADHLPHHLPADGAPEDACQHMRSRKIPHAAKRASRARSLTPPLQETLTYGCLCGNNQRPNVSEYTLTLPYFVCQEWGNQCVKACGNDNKCASACREKHPCGATDPKKYTSTASTSTPTATTTDANTIFTAPGGGSGSSSDKKGAAVALEVGQAYGLVMVMAGLFAGFALL